MRNRTAACIIALGTFAFAQYPHGAIADGSAARVAQAPAPAPAAPAISLVVKPAVGAEALAISGNAPAGHAITLTLYATFSRDLPDVVLTRQTVLTDPNGAFATTAPIAPGFFRGALITVLAATSPFGPSATARVTVRAPNITVPPDNVRKDLY